MRASDIKRLIVTLLSSARNPDIPSHCLGLTCRQICNHIAALLPPDQVVAGARGLWDRVVEQLEVLESEFPPLSGKLSTRFDPSTRGPNRRP